MLTKTRNSIPSYLVRILFIALIAAIIGSTIGVVTVMAETESVNVPGAGNVGTAATVGYWTSGAVKNAFGYSQSSVTLYYLYAGIRLWHGGGVDLAHSSSGFYSKKQQTNQLSSVVAEPFSTRSAFRYSTSTGSAVRYTGFPDNQGDCADYWYNGWWVC